MRTRTKQQPSLMRAATTALALAQAARRATAALAIILLTATTALATVRTVTYTIGFSSGNGYYLTGDDGTQSAYWSQVTEHHTTLNLTLGSDVTISIASADGQNLIVGDLNESSAVIAGYDRDFDNDIDVTVTSQSHYICHFKMIGLGYNTVPVQTSMESFDNEQSSTLN